MAKQIVQKARISHCGHCLYSNFFTTGGLSKRKYTYCTAGVVDNVGKILKEKEIYNTVITNGVTRVREMVTVVRIGEKHHILVDEGTIADWCFLDDYQEQ